MRMATIAAATLQFLDVPCELPSYSRLARRQHRGLRVGAVCTERELKPASGQSSGGQTATSDDSGPEANVITRLLKIELDPAKPGCCNATIAVQ